MYVLITTAEGVMTCDANVRVFVTHDEAHEAMRDEIIRWTKVVEEYDDDEMKSVVIEENEAYDENDPDSMTWHIFEVPGTFAPEQATKTCPECGTELFDDMRVCYGCLHEFWEE